MPTSSARRRQAKDLAANHLLGPVGSELGHLLSDRTHFGTINWISGETRDLGGKARVPTLALGRLGNRLPSGLRAGDAALAGDVLQRALTLGAEAKRKGVRGSHLSPV